MRAGVGTAAYFLLTGIIFATWASRVPAIKGGLDLSDGHFAIALLGLEAGAVLGLQLEASWYHTWGVDGPWPLPWSYSPARYSVLPSLPAYS